MSDIRVGDVVLPDDFREYEMAFTNNHLRVTHVYKNGKLRAKNDLGNWICTGPADGFYRPTFAQPVSGVGVTNPTPAPRNPGGTP